MIIPTIPVNELKALKQKRAGWTDEMQAFMIKYRDELLYTDLARYINEYFKTSYTPAAIDSRMRRSRQCSNAK